MTKHTEIPLGLKVVEKEPLDAKTKVQTLAEAQELAFNGYTCFVVELNKRIEFKEVNGELQHFDFGGYSHPATHPASMIEEEPDKRFLTDAERNKLSNIENNANNYQHPIKHDPSIIEQDSTSRFVSDIEKANWNDKYNRNEIDNKLTAVFEEIDWKEAVDNFEDLAVTYPLPQNGWTVYVRNLAKKFTWNGVEWAQTSGGEIPLATSSVDGLMSKHDKQKVDNIEENANHYVHPSTHSPSIIAQDSNNRFVSDTEKDEWNSKAAGTHTHNDATTTTSGMMSASDKQKLNGVQENANKYVHPLTHSPSIIDQDSKHRFVSDAEKNEWNSKAASTHTHTSYVAKTGDSMTGPLTATKSVGAPVLKGINGFQSTAGLAGVCGETTSAGVGYLGVFLNNIRAGVMGLIGDFSSAPETLWAAYFEGRTKVNGNLAVGDVIPDTYELDVVGSVHASGNFFADSDKRLKKRVRPIKNALSLVKKLRGVRFLWRKSGKEDIGIIAQEVEKVLPEVVSTNSKGFKSVNYSVLTVVLIEAINEQQKQIEKLMKLMEGK